MSLLDDPSQLFVPTTDHSQRILKRPLHTRTKQETDYLKSFLLQFKPFQELSEAGLALAVETMAFERLKPGSTGSCLRISRCLHVAHRSISASLYSPSGEKWNSCLCGVYTEG